MTATAFALNPALDPREQGDTIAPSRPQLRLIAGQGSRGHGSPGQGSYSQASQGFGRVVPGTTSWAAAPTASVEVYRRRRFIALVAVTILIVATAWAAGISVFSFGAAPGAIPADAAPAVHVVLPGDSYGAIAADLGVANPAVAAQQLRAANGGSELVVGQRLVINVATLTTATQNAAGHNAAG